MIYNRVTERELQRLVRKLTPQQRDDLMEQIAVNTMIRDVTGEKYRKHLALVVEDALIRAMDGTHKGRVVPYA